MDCGQDTILADILFLNRMASTFFLYPRWGYNSWKLFYGYHFIVGLIICTIVQLIITLYLNGFDTLIDFVTIAPNIGVCLMAVQNYAVVRKNRTFYNKFYQHYSTDIWKYVLKGSAEERAIGDKYPLYSKWIIRILFYYSIPLIIIVCSFPWLIMTYETSYMGKPKHYLFPFDGWYPFDKVKWYYAVYTWESLMTAIVVLVFLYSNLSTVFVVTCICMEFKMLGTCLENVITPEDIAEIKTSRNVFDRIGNKLKNVIIRYNFLVSLCNELEIMLGNIMAINYSLGSFLITLTSFAMTVCNELFQVIRCFFFFVSLFIIVLDDCLFGEVLRNHSSQLSNAICCSYWYCADKKTKKTLHMLLARTQKPSKITARGYVVMDLATFTSIISTSYQFFNLLRNVYQEDAHHHTVPAN